MYLKKMKRICNEPLKMSMERILASFPSSKILPPRVIFKCRNKEKDMKKKEKKRKSKKRVCFLLSNQRSDYEHMFRLSIPPSTELFGTALTKHIILFMWYQNQRNNQE